MKHTLGGSGSLEGARQRIDAVDREIVALLGKRAALVRQAFRIKASRGEALLDPRREEAMMAVRRRWARAAGLDEAKAEAVMREILRATRS